MLNEEFSRLSMEMSEGSRILVLQIARIGAPVRRREMPQELQHPFDQTELAGKHIEHVAND